MSIFEKKREISRREFREILRKAFPRIPGAGGQMYSRQKRVKMKKKFSLRGDLRFIFQKWK